jgi:hypothetical protein
MSASWAPQRNARHVRKLGAPTYVRNANARHVRTSASWTPQRNARHIRKLGTQTQHKASSQDGRPNEKLIRKEKRPHKGALGKKMSWRIDKNKFWLGGRLFNMASPRLGAATQRKARPQDGRPNATQGTSARWAPKRKTDPQRKHPHKGAQG